MQEAKTTLSLTSNISAFYTRASSTCMRKQNNLPRNRYTGCLVVFACRNICFSNIFSDFWKLLLYKYTKESRWLDFFNKHEFKNQWFFFFFENVKQMVDLMLINTFYLDIFKFIILIFWQKAKMFVCIKYHHYNRVIIQSTCEELESSSK